MDASTKIDICALIISVCAFVMGYYQTSEAEKANQIGILPLLDIVLIGGTGINRPVGFKHR